MIRVQGRSETVGLTRSFSQSRSPRDTVPGYTQTLTSFSTNVTLIGDDKCRHSRVSVWSREFFFIVEELSRINLLNKVFLFLIKLDFPQESKYQTLSAPGLSNCTGSPTQDQSLSQSRSQRQGLCLRDKENCTVSEK